MNELKHIKASDINVAGKLTTEQIRNIAPTTAFCWIKTGLWTNKNFKMWVRAQHGGQK